MFLADLTIGSVCRYCSYVGKQRAVETGSLDEERGEVLVVSVVVALEGANHSSRITVYHIFIEYL